MLTEGPGKVTDNLCNSLEFSHLLTTFQSPFSQTYGRSEFHQVILNIDLKLFEILFKDIFFSMNHVLIVIIIFHGTVFRYVLTRTYMF